MAGTCAGLLVFSAFVPSPAVDQGRIAAALGFAAALGLVGALDDLLDLGARIKLLIQVALSLVFALFVARIEIIPLTTTLSLPLGPVVGVLGTALWLVVVTNAVNFMDGSNGLAAGSTAIVLAAFSAAAFLKGDVALGAAAVISAVAAAGFLPWNFPKAKLFQGDAGALFSSFMVAALALIGAEPHAGGTVFVLFVPLALLPFLADVLLTLLERARARKPLLDAHSEHLYQRWLAAHGGSHVGLACRVFLVMAVFAGAALLLRNAGPTAQLIGFAVGVAVCGGGWAFQRRKLTSPKLD